VNRGEYTRVGTSVVGSTSVRNPLGTHRRSQSGSLEGSQGGRVPTNQPGQWSSRGVGHDEAAGVEVQGDGEAKANPGCAPANMAAGGRASEPGPWNGHMEMRPDHGWWKVGQGAPCWGPGVGALPWAPPPEPPPPWPPRRRRPPPPPPPPPRPPPPLLGPCG
jgi:hypothetical protein